MTPKEFRAALDVIGWRRAFLADKLGCDAKIVARWASGRAEIPEAIAHWLAWLAAQHARRPSPGQWRVRDRWA